MKTTPARRRTRLLCAAALAAALPLTGMTAAYAADPIDGAPTIGDSLFAGIGNTGYDVKHYDVDIHYTHEATGTRDARSIEATTTIDAVAPQPLRSFFLDFEGLTIDSLKVNGEDAAFERSSDKPIEAFKVKVTPAAPVEGEFEVEVQYSGVPSEHVDLDGSSEGWVQTPDGATALGQPVGTMTWIPSNNTPADKATFDISVTAPTQINGKNAAVASNGELIRQVPVGGSETRWQWKQRNQMATMAAMISIGNYDVIQDTITLSDGRTIPEWSFIDSGISASAKATIHTRRSEIEQITQFLESKFGPYPGNSTGVVVDVTSLGYALETQDRSYFERNISKGTLIHEIAHQWYGDGITPNDWNNIWISEGLASYSSVLYNEAHGSGTTAASYFNTWTNTAPGHSRWTVAPAAMTDPRQLFGWQVYTRGGMTFEALRQALGEDVFNELLREWPQRNMGTSSETAKFQELAEELSGRDLSGFFQDWVYDTDKPAWPSKWELSLSADPADGKVAVGGDIAYTVSAKNTGQVPLEGGVVEVDLSDVLDDASIDADALDASLELDGTTLRWTVPTTAGTDTSTVGFTATVDAPGASLEASARAATLGATCVECETSHSSAAVATSVSVKLAKTTRPYNYSNSATVTVAAESGKSKPTGEATVRVSGKTYTAKLVNGKATVKFTKAITAGDRTVTAKYLSDNAEAFKSSSAKASLTVTKASPKIKATLSKSRIKASQKATVKVQVSVPGSLKAKASKVKVQVFDGSKRLKTATTSSSGKVNVQLPKLKQGTHKISVKVLEGKNLKAKSSVTRTLKVAK